MKDALRETLALHLWKGLGPVLFGRCLQRFGSASAALSAKKSEWTGIERFPKALLGSFDGKKLLDLADREIEKAAKHKIRILTRSDAQYPSELKEIYDPPAVLYVKGSLPVASATKIAVIGSRSASPYGLKIAKEIARDLGNAGVVVVSGLALGIDSAAHEGALASGSPTLAVLGGGLAKIYPRANRKLADRISEAGALISEYPVDEEARPEYFPVRNRIVSGLSRAVVVVEAAEKSGALITVDQALEQGREVFAVPGNADSEFSKGVNRLLRQGARPVSGAADILEDLSLTGAAPGQAAVHEKALDRLEGDEKLLFSHFSGREPRHVDELTERSGLPAPRTITALTRLSIKGLVRELPGKYFTEK